MKKQITLFLYFILLFWQESSLAQQALRLQSWRLGGGGEVVGVQAINQENIEWDPAWNVEAGFEFKNWGLAVEARFWQESSQQGALSVRQTNQQALLWLRGQRQAFDQGLAFVQLGSGLRFGQVENQLGDERVDVKKTNELVSGFGLGFGWLLSPSWRTELTLKVLKAQTRLSWETSASFMLQFLL